MIVGNVMAILQCALLPFRSLFRTAEVKTAGNSRHSGHLRQTRYQPGQEREFTWTCSQYNSRRRTRIGV